MLRNSTKQVLLILIEKYKSDPEKLKRLVPLYAMGLQDKTDHDELRQYCATEPELKSFQLVDDPDTSTTFTSDRLITMVDTFLKNRVVKDMRIRNMQICDVSAAEVHKTFCNDQKPFPAGSFKSDDFLQSDPIRKLFAQPACRENLLFSIGITNMHIFVIVKLNDSKNSYYRVYHSWLGLFSLGEWLELDPKSSFLGMPDQVLKIYQNFNKFLTVDEVKDFMKHIKILWDSIPKLFNCIDCDIFINEFNPYQYITAKTLLTDNPKAKLRPFNKSAPANATQLFLPKEMSQQSSQLCDSKLSKGQNKTP